MCGWFGLHSARFASSTWKVNSDLQGRGDWAIQLAMQVCVVRAKYVPLCILFGGGDTKELYEEGWGRSSPSMLDQVRAAAQIRGLVSELCGKAR